MVSAKTIGKAVKEHRRGLRLTQAQLAEAVGKSPDAISQIERGVNMPSVETLAQISRSLMVSVDALVFSGGDKKESSSREISLRLAGLKLSRLDDRDLKIALRQIQAFEED